MNNSSFHKMEKFAVIGVIVACLILIRYFLQGTSLSLSLSENILAFHNAWNYFGLLQMSVYALLIYASIACTTSHRFPRSFSPAVYIATLMAAIVFFRLPSFLMDEMNPDEGLQVASALTLLSDPVYWRSVAVATHGPLVTLPILIPRLFGLSLDYGTTRLVGSLLMGGSAGFLYLLIRKFFDDRNARLLILPVVTFLALPHTKDFVAYNGEYSVIFLMMLELFLLGFIMEGKSSRAFFLFAGFVLGAMPFAKMQSIPLMAVLGCTGIFLSVIKNGWKHHWKCTLCYVGGILIFQVMVFCYLISFGLLQEFLVRYIECTFTYVENDLSFGSKVIIFLKQLITASILGGYYFLGMIFVSMLFPLWALFLCFKKKHAEIDRYTAFQILSPFKICFFAFVLVTAAAFAIIVPATGFIHYYLLLVFPLAISALASTYCFFYWSGLYSRVLVTFIFGIGLSAIQFFPLKLKVAPTEFMHDLANQYYNSWGKGPISSTIRQYKKPGEKLVIWGWSDGFYVETESVMGVRTSMVIICRDGFMRLKNYFVSSYASELKNSHAPVLIDTVAPGQFTFHDRSLYGFHLYPQIAAVINEEYIPVKEAEGVMIYVSKQRLQEIRRGVFLP
jgi:hypothetical protein